MKPVTIGRVIGMDLCAGPSALPSLTLLAVIFFAIGTLVFDASVIVAILGAVGLTVFHVGQEIVHQWGHSFAARRVGHPMTGVRLWLIFGASQYPLDEPELPASAHLRRAMGGPIVSFVVSFALAPIAWFAWSGNNASGVGWLAIAAFFDSLLFSVGAVLPLGFNDGSSILRALKKR